MRILNLKIYKREPKNKDYSPTAKLFRPKKKPMVVRGNYRLSAGMYRTIEEQEEYLQKSLKRKLP